MTKTTALEVDKLRAVLDALNLPAGDNPELYQALSCVLVAHAVGEIDECCEALEAWNLAPAGTL
jgi:hypothetical protein